MSTVSVQEHKQEMTIFYLAISGFLLAGVIAHAQYVLKVGELWVVLIVPAALIFMITYACQIVQRMLLQKMQRDKLKPTFGKEKGISAMFNSVASELFVKTVAITLGLFAAIYFNFASALNGVAPAIIAFIVAIDTAGAFILLIPAYIEGKHRREIKRAIMRWVFFFLVIASLITWIVSLALRFG